MTFLARFTRRLRPAPTKEKKTMKPTITDPRVLTIYRGAPQYADILRRENAVIIATAAKDVIAAATTLTGPEALGQFSPSFLAEFTAAVRHLAAILDEKEAAK